MTGAISQKRIGAQLGCRLLGGRRAELLVWAPRAERVDVRLVEPAEHTIEMIRCENGYYHAIAEGVERGTLYFYRLNGRTDRADPASRFQPRGVHGPSMVMDEKFEWSDRAWEGLPLEECIFYEIHVGTFTPEGTFAAICERLDDLKTLGVTAVELMPVAQFPGARNWGYDGVYPYAVQNSYGGPEGLKRLVDACHARGLAVALDVVYNHLGPEGNYLADFGPYFTRRYLTPWGEAINFDGSDSDEVRRYFIENALAWITEFHIDALRLDAVHAIVDRSARPFLEELGERVHERAAELGRHVWVIAESDRNDPRLVRRREQGGLGLDAVWSDDFHHALHALITREQNGYYADFGSVAHLARAFTARFVYSGQYSAYRRRRHGSPAGDVPARRFVVFAQNHDQVGNRMLGERLAALALFEDAKLAAAAVLLSPYLPLLFMGEEYGEMAPFLYFVSHGDEELIEAVRRGRTQEFAGFGWSGDPPDPQAKSTFLRSKIDWQLRTQRHHRTLRDFYEELIRLRRQTPALTSRDSHTFWTTVHEEERALVILRECGRSQVMVALCFGDRAACLAVPCFSGGWSKELDSGDERWLGGGSRAPARLEHKARQEVIAAPRSVIVYRKRESP